MNVLQILQKVIAHRMHTTGLQFKNCQDERFEHV